MHQGAPWTTGVPEDGGRYPDPAVLYVDGDLEYLSHTTDTPTLPEGSSDWQLYEGPLHPVTDSRAVASYPTVQCRDMTAKATATFDEFVVREFDEEGNLLRVVGEGSVTQETSAAWYPWSSDGNGVLEVVPEEGHVDPYALAISGDSDMALFSTRLVFFLVTTGHSYQISGWAKGSDIETNTQCQFALNFYAPAAGGSVLCRDAQLLDHLLSQRLRFGEQHNVPMAVTEFGLMRSCFEEQRGGLAWLTDMVNVLDAHQLSYVFFTYHSMYMGIYGDENQLPNPSIENRAVSDFFRSHLGG